MILAKFGNLYASTPKHLLLGVLLFSCFYSCVSTKSVTYLQGQGSLDTTKYTTLATINPVVAKIQADDILAITVSSLSEESNLLFNFSNLNAITTTNFPGAQGGGIARNQPLGYLVDPAGNIEMPLVGKTMIAGMTLEEAGTAIKGKLNNYLKEPTVNVRMLNHKFTIIGEVNRPGVYNLLDNHTTLLEVIGMAGDLTIFGKRENVMLIRTSNGKREVVKLDLTSRDFMNSPYYYIQNNDMVYIETLKGKITSTDRTIQLIPIVTGVASTFILLLNLILK
jgi:polysaccharide export outer membrane protein